MRSDTFGSMEMVAFGDLRLHWGLEGIRLTRATTTVLKSVTTREARWLALMLPIAAQVVEHMTGENEE